MFLSGGLRAFALAGCLPLPGLQVTMCGVLFATTPFHSAMLLIYFLTHSTFQRIFLPIRTFACASSPVFIAPGLPQLNICINPCVLTSSVVSLITTGFRGFCLSLQAASILKFIYQVKSPLSFVPLPVISCKGILYIPSQYNFLNSYLTSVVSFLITGGILITCKCQALHQSLNYLVSLRAVFPAA